MFPSSMRTTTPTTTLPRVARRGYNAILTSMRSYGMTGSGRIRVVGQLERKPNLVRPSPCIIEKSLCSDHQHQHQHHHAAFSSLTGASFRYARSAHRSPTVRVSPGGKTKAHPSSFSLMSTYHSSNPIQSSTQGTFAIPAQKTSHFTPMMMMIRPKGVNVPLSSHHHFYQHQMGAISRFSSFMGGGRGGPRSRGRLIMYVKGGDLPPRSREDPWFWTKGAELLGAATVLLGKIKYALPAIDSIKSWTKGAELLGAATMVFEKIKYALPAIDSIVLISLGSMLLSIGAYSIFFGWSFAVGMVGLMLIHEMGHVLVMLQRGIPFPPMIFIPFMGAVILLGKKPRDAWEAALIALGGPVLGSLGAAAVAVGAHATQSQLLFALADFGFIGNLGNLLPYRFLDGEKIAIALSPYAGVAGLGLCGLLAFHAISHNLWFHFFLLVGGYHTYQRFYDPYYLGHAHHLPPNYYDITATQRAVLAVSYFGLIAALIAAMDANDRFIKPTEVLRQEGEITLVRAHNFLLLRWVREDIKEDWERPRRPRKKLPGMIDEDIEEV